MPCTCCMAGNTSFHYLFGGMHYRHMASVILIVYLIVGMVVFSTIEWPHEKELVDANREEHAKRQRRQAEPAVVENVSVALQTWQQAGNASNSLATVLANVTVVGVLEDPLNSSRVVLLYVRRNDTCEEAMPKIDYASKWTLAGSLFFAITVVTTIGYGNLSPSTETGKLVCVFYAIFGIPIFQIVLEHIRNLFISFIVCLEKQFTCSVFGRFCGFGDDDEVLESSGDFPKKVLERPRLCTLVIFVSGYLAFIVFPSLLFSYMEGWGYLTSLYYNFISLTTIGFGDMVAATNRGSPGVKYDEDWELALYRVFLAVWVFLGLTFACGLLEIGRLQIERLLKFFSQCCCCSTDKVEQDSTGNIKADSPGPNVRDLDQIQAANSQL